jgi:hypothetical protein
MSHPRQIPVIVGVGESIDRENLKEPRALLIEAVRAAALEAPGILQQVDSIDVVAIHSWRYQDIAQVVARELGLNVVRAVESVPGGEKPIRLLGEAAERIVDGSSRAALLCGAEAARTRARALQTGTALDWGPTDTNAKALTALDFVTAQAARYQLVQPTQVYPLYENATRHAWGQSAEEADIESALLWSRYSQAAADNPIAWLRRAHRPEQIREETADNRLIAYPYRKLMVANPMVNQGAAILVTSLFAAQEAGISRDRIVHVWGGARANEPGDFLRRDRYDHSTAQDAVLNATLLMAGKTAADIDLFEFYSCFPTVPKMARRALGMDANVRPSITGGLTFFGGPANNFMTHAIAAGTRAIRSGAGRNALLYGQGEFVTKHAAIVLSKHAPPEGPTEMRDVQAVADAAAQPVPPLLEDYEGAATIESFTIVYDRAGQPVHAPVIARTAAKERVLARVPGEDVAVIGVLADRNADPIGKAGWIEKGANELLRFRC